VNRGESGEGGPHSRREFHRRLARLVFGAPSPRPGHENSVETGSPNTFVPSEALALDLDDPGQSNLGDFELRERLGEGGMGTVYRARQRSLDREVALKLLSAGPWASEDFIARFKREARQAARLQHPNIVAVHGIGEQEGLIFYAMELVPGETMSRMLERRQELPAREAAMLIRTIAEAVDYAHRLGVLHLDLKPGNVLLNTVGVPKIADFGLARNLGGALSITNESVAGTPSYMAPEQAETDKGVLTPATDVWALGAMLYECLTGAPPFQGATTEETLRLLREARVRRPSRNLPVPADIEAICLKCLSRKPMQRYRSARELADDLGRFIEGRQVSVRPLNTMQRIDRWARREPQLAMVAALAFLTLAIGLIATAQQWRHAQAESTQARQNLWLQRHETAWRLSESNQAYQAIASLAANLREQESAGDDEAAQRERLRLGLALSQMPLLIDEIDVGAPIHTLALSPNGRYVAVGLGQLEVALYEVSTGRQRWRVRLKFGGDDDPQLRWLQFTSDGRYLVVTRHWMLLSMRPSGLHMRRLAVADGRETVPPDFPGLVDQTWSDDGNYVLLHRTTPRRETQLFDARTWHAISAPMERADPEWLIAPGAKFVVSWYDRRPSIEIRDPATLRPRHELLAEDNSNSFFAWAISPDARWLALGRRDGEVLLVNPDTGERRTLVPGPRDAINWLRFSSDGSLLSASANDGSLHVWVVATGELLGQPLHLDDELWGHQLERDGDTVLALAMHWDRVSLWGLTGTAQLAGAPVLLVPDITHTTYVPRFASVFDPRRALLATGGAEGSLRLWRLPTSPLRGPVGATQREDELRFDGEHLVAVEGRKLWVFGAEDQLPRSPIMELPQPVGFALLTPDGRSLIATSGREVHVFDWRKGQRRYPPIVLADTPTRLLLSADGRSVLTGFAAYRKDIGNTNQIQAHAVADGRPLGPAGLSRIFDWKISPDGAQVAIAADGAISLRRLTALDRVIQHIGHANPTGDHFQYLAFAPDRDELVQLQLTWDPTPSGKGREVWLERWARGDFRLRQRIRLDITPKHLLVRASDGLAAVNAMPGQGTAFQSVPLLVDRDGHQRPLHLTHYERLVRAQAFSPDGHILAQALRDGVILHDADSATPLGPPLRVPLAQPDVISQLAFAPDGRKLVARTFSGRWLVWRLQADQRPLTAIAAEAAELAPERGRPYVPPSTSLRQGLRARDPGVAAVSVHTEFSPWSCLAPEDVVLPRIEGTPSRLVDLSGYYNRPLWSKVRELFDGRLGNLCQLPVGTQRILGTDYDIRGRIKLGSRPQAGEQSTPASLRIEPLPYRQFSRVNLLGFGGYLPDLEPGEPLAILRLHYRHGEPLDIPLRYQNELGAAWESPAPKTRLAWVGSTPQDESRWPGSMHLYAVSLPNPQPDREVVALEIRTVRTTWGGLNIFALTLDPLTGNRHESVREAGTAQ
jgi:eukaryotic-like serine/threonine-protein kinase